MAFGRKLPPLPPTPPNADPSTLPDDVQVDPSVKATKGAPAPTAPPNADDRTKTINDPTGYGNDIVPADPAAVAEANNAEPPYDPKNPDPWIIYNYKIGNNGQTPGPDQLDYWHKKLASGEITGTGQPADYNYWGTRLRRQGVDDLNPQGASKPNGGYLGAANQYGGLFGQGGISGFLGGSLVPTDAGAFETLQQRIKDILGGGGGLDSRNLSAGASAGAPGSGGDSTSSSGTPVGAPAPAAVTNANPAAPVYGTPSPTTSSAFNPGAGGSGDTKARDAGILGSLLKGPTNDAVASPVANHNPSVIPDRAAGLLTSIFGLSPVLAAGNAGQRLNHPGDIIFGNPIGGPQGPTDPNLQPTTPEEQARNAQILAGLLGNNEANGGI